MSCDRCPIFGVNARHCQGRLARRLPAAPACRRVRMAIECCRAGARVLTCCAGKGGLFSPVAALANGPLQAVLDAAANNCVSQDPQRYLEYIRSPGTDSPPEPRRAAVALIIRVVPPNDQRPQTTPRRSAANTGRVLCLRLG